MLVEIECIVETLDTHRTPGTDPQRACRATPRAGIERVDRFTFTRSIILPSAKRSTNREIRHNTDSSGTIHT